jgi:superoxide dismutase, Fe-Mn family
MNLSPAMLLSLIALILISLSVNNADARKIFRQVRRRTATEKKNRQVCVDKETYWDTINVTKKRAGELIADGAKDGKCDLFCANEICNHKPCFPDFNITTNGKQCYCLPEAVSNCSGVNTRCNALDESCRCVAGFAGNASSPAGCPDVGFSLPDLPYKNEALEPYIDTRTMMLHHDRHHQTAVDSLNRAVNGTAEASLPVIDLVKTAITTNRTVIRNNAGGHYNHAFFWRIMTSANESAAMTPSAQLQALINLSFGNTSTMIARFNAAGTPSALFGSGWVWVNVNGDRDKLVISTSPNQDNPLMFPSNPLYPIIGLDVWEHAYYLKYQNLRADYVKNFWSIINWNVVSSNCQYVIANSAGVSV